MSLRWAVLAWAASASCLSVYVWQLDPWLVLLVAAAAAAAVAVDLSR